MSLAHKLLNLLADCQPKSNLELADALEVDVAKVRAAMNYLQKTGRVSAHPITYEITATGHSFAATKERVFREPHAMTTCRPVNSVFAMGGGE